MQAQALRVFSAKYAANQPAWPGRESRFNMSNNLSNNTMHSSFSTCDFCDAHKSDTSGDFRVLPPVFRDYGAVKQFCGPVVTVKCYEDNSVVKALLESPGIIETAQGPRAAVLVVDGGASLRRALVGGLIGAAAARNGWAGVVVDGAVRDLAELASQAVGIRALAHIPMPTDRRNQGQRDVEVHVQSVRVVPGDWLYADADGMVVSRSPLL